MTIIPHLMNLLKEELIHNMQKFNFSENILNKKEKIIMKNGDEDEDKILSKIKKEILENIRTNLNNYYTHMRKKQKTGLERLKKKDRKMYNKLKKKRRIKKDDLDNIDKKELYNDFDSFYDKLRSNFIEQKRFNGMNELDYITKMYLKRVDIEKKIKKQKLNLINEGISIKFKKHILIFNFDVNDFELIEKLINHYHNSKICLISNDDLGDTEELNRQLEKNNNLYYIYLDSLDTVMLERLNLDEVLKCFLLSKHDEKKNISEMLNYQLLNFFNYNYKFEVFTEQENAEKNLLLGSTPFLNNRVSDQLFHPMYMSGKILYTSEISEIFSLNYINPNIADAWLSLIYCGNPDQNYYKMGTFPNLITIDIPKFYNNKFYKDLVIDLFKLEINCIPLGIHVMNPLSSNKDFSEIRPLINFNNLKTTCEDSKKFHENFVEESI